MNKDNLNRALHEIVEHDLPKEIDMWQQIEAKLPKQNKPRGVLRLATAPIAASIVVMLLVLGTASYAMWGPGGGKRDKGLDGAEQAGLFTEINQTVMLEDLEITVTEGYADTQRIAISFEIDEESFDPDADFFFAQLRDQAGNQFMESSGAYGPNRIDLVFSTQILKVDEDGNLIFDQDFSANYMHNIGESVDLELQLYLVDSWMFNVEMDEYRATAFFKFTLPISHAETVEVNQSLSINDITVTVETLKLAPSQSLLTMCYTLPDGQDWQPVTSLTLDGELAQLDGLRLSHLPSPEDTERCMELSFNVFYDQSPSDIVFTVEKLKLSPNEGPAPEYWNEVVRILAEEYDIEVEFVFDEGRGQRLDEISRPDGMADDIFWQTILQAQDDASPGVDGPWIFEISAE